MKPKNIANAVFQIYDSSGLTSIRPLQNVEQSSAWIRRLIIFKVNVESFVWGIFTGDTCLV